MARRKPAAAPTLRILVVYASVYGHTAKVAAAVGRALEAAGAQAEVVDLDGVAAGGDLAGVADVAQAKITRAAALGDVDDYGAVIVAASVHAGGYSAAMVDWVRRRARSMNRLPTAFVSVCLGVLQDDAKVQQDLRDIQQRFFERTGWQPTVVEPVAGALAYSRYNLVTRLMMKRIAGQAGGDTDTRRDYEYTDWQRLDRFGFEFVRAVAATRTKQTVAKAK